MKQDKEFSFFTNPERARESFQKIAGTDEIDRNKFDEVFPLLLDELKESPDPDMAIANFERFSESIISRMAFFSSLKQNPAVTQILLTLFGHSQFLSDAMVRNPEYFDWFIDSAILRLSKTRDEMEQELGDMVNLFTTRNSRLNAMRRFKRREMLRIGLRDLMNVADVETSTRELSYLADVCLDMACRLCFEELRKEHGIPIEETAGNKEAAFAVIGMGKLGGNELNYSSDIDVIFVYSEEGKTNGSIPVTNHEFFTKLSQNIIQVISGITREGYIFRLDARLRPEGLTGPICRSLESTENYYASFGATWERLAMIKARPCAGDPELGKAFVKMIEPFIYQKYTGYTAIEDLHKMKYQMDQQIAKKGTTYRNVKLGYGGIREIEFSVQILQLLYGGKNKTLKGLGTLACLRELKKLKFITEEEESFLCEAYCFLRNVEHRLQIMHEQQLHTLPENPEELNRFALRMGLKAEKKKEAGEVFLTKYKSITDKVHTLYTQFFKLPEEKEPDKAAQSFEWLYEESVDPQTLSEALTLLGFFDPKKARENLLLLAQGPNYMHVPTRTQKLFIELTPYVLDYASKSPDPDQALNYLERFVGAQGSRGTFYEVLLDNPKVLELLLVLFGSSQFLSDAVMAKPDLFGIVTLPGELGTKKDELILKQSLYQIIKDETDLLKQMNLARRFKDEELLRISLRDLLGFISLEEFFEEFTALADAVTEEAMHCVIEKCRREHPSSPAPKIAVIGMGKFGGSELSYSSDLDLIFVTDNNANEANQTVAAGIIDFLSRNTEEGFAFRSDARLRPDGDQGPLVPTLQSCREYYLNKCATWEKQSLTKARFICGDEAIGIEFMKCRDEAIYGKSLTDKEKDEIQHMRVRIEKERSSAKAGEKEIKLGAGGIMDIEFAVQYLQLKTGFRHKEVRSPVTVQALKALKEKKVLSEEIFMAFNEGYHFLRTLENKLRIVNNQSLDKLPNNPEDLEHCARRMGFHDTINLKSSEQLLKTLSDQTKAIREAYTQTFS